MAQWLNSKNTRLPDACKGGDLMTQWLNSKSANLPDHCTIFLILLLQPVNGIAHKLGFKVWGVPIYKIKLC